MRARATGPRLGVGITLLAATLVGAHVSSPADAAPRKAARYRAVVLPLHAEALNDHGLVAGYVGPDSDSRAATWRDGRLSVLPLPRGATRSSATAVNDHGVVAGSAMVPGSGHHAVVWVHGRPRWLPEPARHWDSDRPVTSSVDAINDRGDVVGAADAGLGNRITWWLGAAKSPAPRMTGSGRGTPTELTNRRVTVGGGEASWMAVRWSSPGAQPRDLPHLSRNEVVWNYARSVNESGQVVGTEYAWDDEQRTFVVTSVLWSSNDVPSALPHPRDGGSAVVSQINDKGLVVGSYEPPGGGPAEVAVWSGADVVRTGVPGAPVDLNDKGAMVVRDGTRSLYVRRQ